LLEKQRSFALEKIPAGLYIGDQTSPEYTIWDVDFFSQSR
jgi:hypothetical protein